MGLSLAQTAKPTLTTEDTGTGAVKVQAFNPLYTPITLWAWAQGENVMTSGEVGADKPIVVPARSRSVVFEVRNNNPQKPGSFEVGWRYIWGDYRSQPDKATYALPLPLGKAFEVTQGNNGRYSHQHINAIDFDVAEGSEIFAAREGVVVSIQETFDRGGASAEYMDKANFVEVLHPDGTFALYGHLKLNGIVVLVGDQISRGQLIGYSGNTGYSTGPHLHFQVHRYTAEGLESIPVLFETEEEGPVVVQAGYTYTRPAQQVATAKPKPLLERIAAQHDPSILYSLPFPAGQSAAVVQDQHGSHTKECSDSHDFAIPAGTRVFAAREGVVAGLKLEEPNNPKLIEGSCLAVINHILVRHPDGTYSVYGNLKQHSALVKLGDSISRGQAIAVSTTQPLHFHVHVLIGEKQVQTLTVRFYTAQGNVLLQAGVYYTRPY
jgi:murein DD-endopeptidase MepM/ murein hydrolase activator NlpD